MPSPPPPNMSSNFDEEQWVINVRQALDEDFQEIENENPVHIFTVPPTLLSIDPFSFIPLQVSIGPYHFSRPELSEMGMHKLEAARRNQRDIHPSNFKLQNLVEYLIDIEPVIRSCYHKFLNFNGETLAWMLAVDASFLSEFLQVCAITQGKDNNTSISSKKLSNLVNLSQSITNSVVFRDIIMLENQIPLFVLRKLLELQLSSIEKVDEKMFSMLDGLCDELSPFKTDEDLANKIHVKNCTHLLDVLYRFVIPKGKGFSDVAEVEEQIYDQLNEEVELEEDSNDKKYFYNVWKKMSLSKGPEDLIQKIKFLGPLKKVLKIPLSLLPVFKDIVSKIFNSSSDDREGGEATDLKNGMISKPPLLDEIEIPSVTELAKSGVCFRPTDKGIESISFDAKTATFFLPTLSLDVNSPVVLRNLVAYEACNAKGPLILTRYTELLNGIIDTKEDARYLRERGIIINRLKSDEDVTNLCNGMSKSIRLTKVPPLDKVIEEVNKFHNGTWSVKLRRYLKRYVFDSWQLLTLIGAIMMVIFMGLQAFCSVYNCPHFLFNKDLGS